MFWNILYKALMAIGTPLVLFPKWTISFLRFWISNEILDLQCKTKWIFSFSPQFTFKDICVTEPLWKLARLTAEENQNWDNQAEWMYSWRLSHGHFHIACLSAFPRFLALVLVYFVTSCWKRALFFSSDFVLARTKKEWGFKQSLWRTKGLGVNATMPWLLYLNQPFCANTRW